MKIKNFTHSETSYTSGLFISFEIILIYLMAGLIALTFFDSIIFVLTILGYMVLVMLTLVLALMIVQTIYNFSKGIKLLLA